MSNERHIEDLKEIRSLMEQSTRFLSLSGWSGIMAGVYALIGADIAYNYSLDVDHSNTVAIDYTPYIVIAIGVMASALITGIILTQHRAKKDGQTIFTKTAIRMLLYTAFPGVVGLIVIAALLLNGDHEYVLGLTLIFYGLGLINGSKYTLSQIRNFGVLLVLLGLLALFLPHDLIFWCNGFGTGHIIYGARMWMRYER